MQVFSFQNMFVYVCGFKGAQLQYSTVQYEAGIVKMARQSQQ